MDTCTISFSVNNDYLKTLKDESNLILNILINNIVKNIFYNKIAKRSFKNDECLLYVFIK